MPILKLDSVWVSGDEPVVKIDLTRFKDYAKRTLQFYRSNQLFLPLFILN